MTARAGAVRSVRAVAARVRSMRAAAAVALGSLGVLGPCLPAHAAFECEWPDARAAVAVGAVEPWAVRVLGAIGDAAGEPNASPRWSFALSGGELFGLREARGAAAETALDAGGTHFAFRAATFGSPLYAERTLAVQCARRVSDGLVCGARLRALGVAADGCESAWSFAVDASMAARVTGLLALGGRFDNVSASEIGGSPVASSAVVGASLELDRVTLEAGIRIEEGFDAAPLLSVDAAVGEWLSVRAGADGGPGAFGVGLGVGGGRGATTGSRPAVDVAWRWHPELGVSSFVSVRFGP